MSEKTKYEINLENWEFISPLSEIEYSQFYKTKYYPSKVGWYKCKNCGKLKNISNAGFKTKLTKCICKLEEEKSLAEGAWKQNLQNWNYIRPLTNDEYCEQGYKKKEGKSWYECKTCQTKVVIDRYFFKKNVRVCDNGCHGVGKNTSQIILGVNDLATTHPHLVKYFVNEADSQTIKACSTVKKEMKCPNCNYRKTIPPVYLTVNGFNCPVCSDGISYPEKFIGNLLKTLKVDFETQKYLSKNYRYDFYIPSLNMIIETHGIQHYKAQRPKHWKTYDEEHENDINKWLLAQLKLGKNMTYVVLDCRYSNMEWIKNTILTSILTKFFNFNTINWRKIHIDSESSLVMEVIEYYNNTNKKLKEIAKVFNISDVSVGRYLKKGYLLGLCNYTPTPNSEKYKGKKIVLIKNGVVEKVFQGVKECAEQLETPQRKISALAKGINNTHFKTVVNLDNVGFYYLDSSDWERDKYLFKDPNNILEYNDLV